MEIWLIRKHNISRISLMTAGWINPYNGSSVLPFRRFSIFHGNLYRYVNIIPIWQKFVKPIRSLFGAYYVNILTLSNLTSFHRFLFMMMTSYGDESPKSIFVNLPASENPCFDQNRTPVSFFSTTDSKTFFIL